MAKRKRSPKPSQPRYKSSSPSQFDKRKRLDVPNPNRKKTVKARVPLVGEFASLIASMASMLDCRLAFRLSIIVAGMMLADDRRVAAACFAATDVWSQLGISVFLGNSSAVGCHCVAASIDAVCSRKKFTRDR